MVRIKVSNDAMIKVVSYGHPVMFNLRSCWHLHARLLSTHTPFNFDPWYTGRLPILGIQLILSKKRTSMITLP
jgi:hypothetical protein